MKIARWFVLFGLMALVMSICIVLMKDIATSNSNTSLLVVSSILAIIPITAILKMQKVWMVVAMIANIILLAIIVGPIEGTLQKYGISIAILVSTLVYISLWLLNKQLNIV